MLETDLTEALDELGDALEREKEFEVCLNNSKKREKALLNKQRRLEETTREQENEISYLTLSRHSNQKINNKDATTSEAGSQTDFPFYRERSVDVHFEDVDLKDAPRNQTPVMSGQAEAAAGPEGVDLLNSGTLMRKKNEILREAKRRRTAKKKRDKNKEYAPAASSRTGKLSFLNKLCCCCVSKEQSAEYDIEDGSRRM